MNGEKKFSFTNSPKCHFNIGAGDSNFIRVEAIAKFYNCLKSFKGLNQIMKVLILNFKVLHIPKAKH